MNGITTDKEPQNHCATTCSIAKDPPTLLQETNRQDGCRSSDGQRCSGCLGCFLIDVAPINGTPLPCRFQNSQSERNPQPAGNPTAKNEPYCRGCPHSRTLPLLRKPLPPCRFWNPRSERNQSQRETKRQRWNGLAVGGVRTLRGNGITANGDPQRQEPPCIVIEFKRNSLSSFFLYNNLHIMNLLCIFVPTK